MFFQDLSSYPIIGSQLFSGVNGTAGIINPALCQNPNFISSSLPELSGIKSEKSIEGSPDHSLASVSKFYLPFFSLLSLISLALDSYCIIQNVILILEIYLLNEANILLNV